MLVGHGSMVVGEASAGKTTVCEVLADALTEHHSDGIKDRLYYPLEQYRQSKISNKRRTIRIHKLIDKRMDRWTIFEAC